MSGRRSFLAFAAAACASLLVGRRRTTYADDVSVPIPLQVDLLGRVAAYDRRFASQAGQPATVLLVSRRGDVESTRVAGQIDAALRRTSAIGGRPARIVPHAYSSPAALRSAVESSSAAIVYLTPGFGAEATGIASALDGVAVITVSSVGTDADRGIILAFELVAARPKLVVNLRQARRQQVEFASQFLRLARVIQ